MFFENLQQVLKRRFLYPAVLSLGVKMDRVGKLVCKHASDPLPCAVVVSENIDTVGLFGFLYQRQQSIMLGDAKRTDDPCMRVKMRQ